MKICGWLEQDVEKRAFAPLPSASPDLSSGMIGELACSTPMSAGETGDSSKSGFSASIVNRQSQQPIKMLYPAGDWDEGLSPLDPGLT
jgi:hypothetical protein